MAHDGPSFFDDDAVFDAYARLRAKPGNANDTLEAPALRELLGDVRGHDVLDLGCGDGDYGRELLAAGAASYRGIDGSRRMIERAQVALQGASARLQCLELDAWARVADAEPAGGASRACARLVLHYLEDLRPLLRAVRRALRDDGLFVFSVEHPIQTSRMADDDTRLATGWHVDEYFESGPRVSRWLGTEVVKYHRPIEQHVQLLHDAGFRVEGLREAAPSRALVRDEHEWRRRRSFPLFLAMSASVR